LPCIRRSTAGGAGDRLRRLPRVPSAFAAVRRGATPLATATTRTPLPARPGASLSSGRTGRGAGLPRIERLAVLTGRLHRHLEEAQGISVDRMAAEARLAAAAAPLSGEDLLRKEQMTRPLGDPTGKSRPLHQLGEECLHLGGHRLTMLRI